MTTTSPALAYRPGIVPGTLLTDHGYRPMLVVINRAEQPMTQRIRGCGDAEAFSLVDTTTYHARSTALMMASYIVPAHLFAIMANPLAVAFT